MKPFRGLVITSLVIGLALLFLLGQAPTASMQKGRLKDMQQTLGKPKDVLVKEFLRDLNKNIQPQSILLPGAEYDEESEDPDLPPGMAGLVDKEAYLRLRGDYIDMRRGRPFEEAEELRAAAIRKLEKQEETEKRSNSLAPADQVNWNFLGPAPIPLGQTTTTRVPVSGRTISIAVHPTDPDTVYVGTAQGGLYKSTNGGANWTRLFDFQLESLAIGAVTIDPVDSGIVYVGTGEPNLSADSFAGKGLYIIRNANSATPTLTGPFRLDGSSSDVFSGRSIGRIMVSSTNHNIVYVCTTSGTGGNPNTTVLNPPRAGLYRSTNAQSANPIFEQVQITGVPEPNNRSVIDIQFDPANDNVLIAAVLGASSDGGLYRTANALSATPTFTRTLVLPDGSTNGRAELTATRSGGLTTFYVAAGQVSTTAIGGPACSSTQGGLVRKSTDNGITWAAPMAGSTGYCGGQCFYDIAIAVTPDNQTILLGGAAGSSTANCGASMMKRSTNGGTTWGSSTVTLHADTHALAVAPSNPSVVYVGNDGGIWRSTNAGTNWTTLNNTDFSATQFQGVAVHPYDRNFLLGGTQDNGTNCQNAAGVWSHCQDGDGGYALIDSNAQDTTNVTMYHTFFNQTNSQILFERTTSTAANANGIFSWTSRGCSGTTSNNGIRCADNVLFYAPMALGPGNPNTIYFGTDRLYRSSNRGDAMTLVSQGPLVPTSPGATSGFVVTTIGISPQDDNVRIVGMRNGKVFATTTGSSTLTDVTGSNFPLPNPSDINRNSIGKAVIDPTDTNTAYITFTSFSPPDGQQIFKTTNLGDPVPTWVPVSNGIPRVPVSSIAVDPQDSNTLYAGTDIGVYRSTDGGSNWVPLGQGLPRVAVFDVAISDVQRVLRIATHGRGIWEIGIPGRLLPVLRASGDLSVITEGCAPGNGIIDGHEDVTVRLPIANIGPGPTQDLTVSLEASGGVAFPGPAVVVPSIDPGETGFADIKFNANADCGETITLTYHLQEGGADAGTFVKTYTLGMKLGDATPVESFDGVTAPALPAGWTTARTGGPALWVTSTTNSSPPNSVFGAGSTTAGESSLTSPTIAVPPAPATGHRRGVQLSFRDSFNTEANFDGAILEISIDGGAFADIVAAGGSFETGGYTGTIDPTTDSVLAGRMTWTGNSGGFITTVANLPEAAFGHNAQFRWRLATDTGTNPTGGGIRIDTISLNTVYFVCCEGACMLSCPMNIMVPNDTDMAGAIVNYPPTTYTGNCGQVSSSPISGSFFPLGPTVVTTLASRLDGSSDSCMFNITVNDVQPPTVSQPTVDKQTLWPPEHQLVPIFVDYTASDNDSVSCSLSVSSNEPINGLGDGDTAPDWVVTNAHNLFLRSERGGKGTGRIYTITVTCVDPSGNSTSRNTSVRVPLNQKSRL
jgi:photosystem II stability/assembly factor-like uncharacterized protein